MDCEQARATLCSLYDEAVPEETRAAARAHAAGCPDCASFSRGLAILSALPTPTAPPGLADRVSKAVAAEVEAATVAAAMAAAQVREAPEPRPEGPTTIANAALRPVTGLPPWFTRARLWTATAGVSIVAAGIAVAILVSGQSAEQLASTGGTFEKAASDTAAPAAGSGQTAPSAAAPAAPVTTPDYIAFDSFVYRAADSSGIAPSELTTVGVTQTALRGSDVQALAVLRAPGSKDVVLAVPGGGYQRFTPVTRQMSGRTFGLAATSIERFGVWPGLPNDWTQPTTADGAPYYRVAGTDDLGVSVLVRIGQTPELGFIIAPGTAATDPAAGDPNWTLWLPQPQ